ncbi:MAG: DVU_1551 family NTP transferase [Thermodesulfobacteriota bacterium]
MSRQTSVISAVIPAAGLSTRMHKYKPLLKLGNLTILEHTIKLFKKCNIADIIVVTGHNRDKVEPIIKQNGAKHVFNKDFKTGMFGSVKTGVKNISPGSSGFFLLPVDIPLIRESSIHSLTARFKKNPEHIIMPEFNKESGHPPLIPAWLIPEILNLKTDSNLGKLLLSHKDSQKTQMVHDQGILMDADNKKAYEDLKTRYQTIDIPDKKECHSIIHENLKGEKSIKAHVELVAETAITLAREVQVQPSEYETQEYTLDINLILAGALLHDIKRKEPNHAAVGAQLLLSLGFEKVADIVAQHMDLTLPITDYLTEAQIVYFADKLCKGARLEFNYDKRFKERIKQTPHARNTILKRYEYTQLIQARIEDLVKKPVKSILSRLI